MKGQGFKSVEEIIDNVSRDGEVEFSYKGKVYSIKLLPYHGAIQLYHTTS